MSMSTKTNLIIFTSIPDFFLKKAFNKVYWRRFQDDGICGIATKREHLKKKKGNKEIYP